MNVLITGAGGFIGSHLMDAYPDAVGFDNWLTGKRENCLRAHTMDIRERGELYRLANHVKPELVIHCAASYKDPDKWHVDTDVNIAGAINVAAVAQYHRARVIYFQTVLPPISSYAISKIAAEHYLRLAGVPLTVFRLAAVYGPRNLSGAIPTFYRQVAAGRTCTATQDATRDFVFIDDLVNRVLTTQQDGVFDIRTGVETPIRSIPELIGVILDITPVVELVPRREDDVAHYEMNGTPRVGTPFAEGLRETVDWYEQNGVGETFTHLRIA